MQGKHINVKANKTTINPAILLSTPFTIFPKSNPQVIQKSEEGAGVEMLETLSNVEFVVVDIINEVIYKVIGKVQI
jgi:hypothetical protein